MVCLACLLPIFLVPIVNALPLLIHFLLGKLYSLLGWEYRKPARAPPACPFKPTASSSTQVNDGVRDENNQENEKVTATASATGDKED